MVKNVLYRIFFVAFMAIWLAPASAEDTNSVVNPGFESGTTPWVFYTNGAGTFLNNSPGESSPSAGHITISLQGTNVQLHQKNLVLEAKTRYQLRFKSYSNTGHDLAVSILKHGSPYTIYGLSNYKVDLGKGWNEYLIQFNTSGFSGTVNDARLMFWLAPYDVSGDQYFFDDVILSKASSGTPPTPPTITTQPSNQTVFETQAATFSASAQGTAPLSYQWQKNGVDISGATGATYTTSATTLSENGARFRVIVSNNVGSVTSNEATLIVMSAPSNRQLVMLDVNYEHNTTIFKVPYSLGNATSGISASFFNIPPYVPSNLILPVDYAHGTIYQRLQVFTKPSTKIVKYQICFFQDKIIQEKHACTNRDKLAFTSPGTYYTNQSMTSIYNYSKINWSRSLLIMMLDITDKNGILIDLRSNYNFYRKWDGYPNMDLYYPMKVRYTAIIVPPGGGEPVWPT